MPAANYLPEVLETTEAERLATGFVFTEGPLWHPDGYWFFVDIRQNKLYRITPGRAPEVVKETAGGNGTTFDLQGRLLVCESDVRASRAPAPTEESRRWPTATRAAASIAPMISSAARTAASFSPTRHTRALHSPRNTPCRRKK